MFRTEVLMDVILAASFILLIFLLMIQPGMVQTDYFRQASFAIGCFGEDGGKPWTGKYHVYSRLNGVDGNGWRLTTVANSQPGLRSAVKKVISDDEGYSRAVIMVDFYGSKCVDKKNAGLESPLTVFSQIAALSDFSDWTVHSEIVPCADRAQCESLITVQPQETPG